MNKPIYIIGAGAIGKALAVFLTLENRTVTLIRGSVDNQLTRKEIIVVSLVDGKNLEAEIEIATLSNFKTFDGIIVLTNKSFGNENLSIALQGKCNNSPIIILQNGLGVEKPFIKYGFPEIYRCILFVTSQFSNDSTVRFKPVSTSLIGIVKGNTILLKSIIDLLHSPYFPFRQEEKIESYTWKKAIANSVFNSICPLLEIDNGIFHRNDQALSLAKKVVHECISISEMAGIELSEAEVMDSILLISKSSDGQFISTLQDIRNKRKTEIETLNLEIARIAKQFGKEKTVSDTTLLGQLVKLKSELSQIKSDQR